MKRSDLIKKIAALGSDVSGVLVETAKGDVTRIVDGQEIPADFEYHIIDDISLVNNSIVIHINSQGI